MKRLIRIVSAMLLCLLIASVGFARKPASPAAPSVTGVYEDFTVGKGSGDLEGMRVVIVQAGGGYWAIVQIAAGGAEDPKPEFVEVKVKGMNVSFTASEQKFTATVLATGLRVKDSSAQTSMLKRKPCAGYL